jgi:hypothetical protein
VRPEAAAVQSGAADTLPHIASPPVGPRFVLSNAQHTILRDLQLSLSSHGIDAGVEEIGHGILEALAERPSLCRGLLAAHLLGV